MNLNFRNNFNNINFQKTLVARAGVLTNNKTEKVNIYHLDEEKDVKDLINASKTDDWCGNYYLDDTVLAYWDFMFDNKFDFYTIENKNKEILCYSVIDNRRAKEKKVQFIETMPKMSCYNKINRKTKYIGETMLAYHATQLGKKDFVIGSVADRAKTKKFYKHCGFEPYKTQGAIMDYKKANKFIKLNEQHTGSTIELIG